ncbi:MAG: hypothetical protein J6K89_08020 [Oscillospiraceae bacterium]|nr:hypothetical protein [Oscillospiraceae bacterium]
MLIDRDAAVKAIEQYGIVAINDGRKSLDTVDDIVELMRIVRAISAVDAVPVVYGQWISVDGTQECDEWDCSVCARRLTFGEEMNAEDVYDLNPFCSQCGTRMDRGEQDG